MEQTLSIEYHWNCDQLDSIPDAHREALEEDAENRIFDQLKEGYRSGELITSVRYGKDKVPEEDEEEGLSYSGSWDSKTEKINRTFSDAQNFNQKATHYINMLSHMIDEMPDKGDTCEESQKICLTNALKQFQNTVNGVEDSDFKISSDENETP